MSSMYPTILYLIFSEGGNVADVRGRVDLIVIESQLDAEIVLSLVRCPIHIFQEIYQFLLIQILALNYLFGIWTIGVGGHIR